MAISDWSTTPSSNGNSDATINFQEGQAPSTVNDSARALMARMRHWFNWLGGNTTQGGSSNAYTLTSGESLSAYVAGHRFLWSPNADSTGNVTLNVDSIGAKKVYLPNGTQAGNGDLDADSMYDVVYDTALDSASGGFKIVGFLDTTLTASNFLAVANNLSDLASASTARGNLGLGDMAVADYADAQAFGSSMTVAGDVNVDSGTFFVDVSTDRVGINVTPTLGVVQIGAPSGTLPALHVKGNEGGGGAGIEIGIHVAGTESDLAFNGNAVVGAATSLTIGTEGSTATNYIRFGNSMTDRLTGTAGFSETMRIVEGNVGIGTTSPGDKLEVNGDVTAVDFNATSDARLKENIETLGYGLSAVLAMQPRAYDWIEQKEHDIGFIAQELEAIVPEVVSQKGDYKRVSYGKLVAVMAMAIQELKAELDDLREKAGL